MSYTSPRADTGCFWDSFCFWRVPNAFRTEYLAIRPLQQDGLYSVFFGATQVAEIDLKSPD
jgi:hypothetical protein